MRRFENKSRRPKAKAAHRHVPPRRLENAYTALLGLMTAVVAAQLLASALTAMPAIANVGDRIVISAATRPVTASFPVITSHEIAGVTAAPARGCALNIAKMMRPGGVLSVLAVRPDGVVLSWAGGPTDDGQAQCNPRGEVLVAANDYATLLKTQSAKH